MLLDLNTYNIYIYLHMFVIILMGVSMVTFCCYCF